MRFGHCRVELDCPLCRAADLGRGFMIRNYPPIHQDNVRTCQPGVRLCIVWIFRDCLSKLTNGLVKTVWSALREVETALHIELVGVAIYCCVLRQLFLLLTCQLEPQLPGNVRGDVVLHGRDIRGLAPVLLTPDL